jgi:excisionase family DNA binding protein
MGHPGRLRSSFESIPSENNKKREKTVEERAMETTSDPDALLTPSEVAAMFRVNPKTVTRWARAGKISAIRTLGGHRRFRAAEIRRFLEQVEEGAETP